MTKMRRASILSVGTFLLVKKTPKLQTLYFLTIKECLLPKITTNYLSLEGNNTTIAQVNAACSQSLEWNVASDQPDSHVRPRRLSKIHTLSVPRGPRRSLLGASPHHSHTPHITRLTRTQGACIQPCPKPHQ